MGLRQYCRDSKLEVIMNGTNNSEASRLHAERRVQLGTAKRLTRASFVGNMSEGNGLRYTIG